MTYQDYIIQTANRYGVPPNIALAVAWQESRFNPDASGAAGEVGMFQIMPATGNALGCNYRTVEGNIECGIRNLKEEYSRFGSWELALAAYNAGAPKVLAGFIPTSYVQSVQRQAATYQLPAMQESTGYKPLEIPFGSDDPGMPTFSTTAYATPDASPWLLALLVGLGTVAIMQS